MQLVSTIRHAVCFLSVGFECAILESFFFLNTTGDTLQVMCDSIVAIVHVLHPEASKAICFLLNLFRNCQCCAHASVVSRGLVSLAFGPNCFNITSGSGARGYILHFETPSL